MTEQQLAAMRQLVEAVEADLKLFNIPLTARMVEALSAGRTAIEAETAQEPVAYASAWFALVMNAAAELEDASHCLQDEDAKRVAISGAKHYRDAAKALYTTPPAAQPAEWVGLTEEEANELWEGTDDRDSWELIMKVQAKLREKNGGKV